MPQKWFSHFYALGSVWSVPVIWAVMQQLWTGTSQAAWEAQVPWSVAKAGMNILVPWCDLAEGCVGCDGRACGALAMRM